MTSPKRAEPANEHAKRLRGLYELGGSKYFDPDILAAAAEIERLAARVRELEERPRYDVAELRGKIFSSVKYNPIDAQRVHEALAAIHGLVALERPWLPIETAPRDGTRVELWDGNAPLDEQEAFYGRFYDDDEFDGSGNWYGDGMSKEYPTHYRREPAGPESKPDQETKGER